MPRRELLCPLTAKSSSARRMASRVMPPLLCPSKLRLRGHRTCVKWVVVVWVVVMLLKYIWRLQVWLPAVWLIIQHHVKHPKPGPPRVTQSPTQLSHPTMPNTPLTHLSEWPGPFLEAKRRSCTVMRTRSTACVRLPISSPRSSLDM